MTPYLLLAVFSLGTLLADQLRSLGHYAAFAERLLQQGAFQVCQCFRRYASALINALYQAA